MTLWKIFFRTIQKITDTKNICSRWQQSRGPRWIRPTSDPARTTRATSSASTRCSRGTTGRSSRETGFTGQVHTKMSSLCGMNFVLFVGARMLYKNLPRNVGLRRLTLHKSATGPNVNYILLVECSHFLDNINQVSDILLKI